MTAFQKFSNPIHNLVKLAISTSILVLCHACNTETPKPPSEALAQAAEIEAVVALGRIEPEGEVIKLSVPNAQDSRVNQILVKEGEFVRENQVIAILQGIDRREADLRDAQADVRLRTAELAKVTQGDAKKAQIVAQRASIERLEAQLKGQILRQRAAIASAEATLREARQTLDRRQSLLREGAINRADVDVAQRDVTTAQATLTERTAELAQTSTTLTAEVNQEQAKLAELQEVRPVDVEIAHAQLEKATIAVEQQQANVRDAQVRVPIAGQILKINTRVGEQVNTSQGIVELARTDRMFAIAEISETDIAKIRSGQQATITSEYGSFAGEIRGTVEQVGLQIGKKSLQDASAANSPAIDQNARVIEVKVRINKGDNKKVVSLTNIQVRIKLEIAKNASLNQNDEIATGGDR
ncbi:MAG: HlyD family efflux transporter periplasmic adaptor subunit [Phormidesmis sp. CAN_BIN44]|nr:HlyD family efflux transporter periplasmic adaptor subunit [Phormidesmis sp. CAN_BIN44]